MRGLRLAGDSLLHMMFPHVCCGCGSDLLDRNSELCLRCIASMPVTGFVGMHHNPVEQKFWGRLPLDHALAMYYFTRESLLQRLMHQLKYKGNREIGRQLGGMMGRELQSSAILDALIPLPLFPSRESRRGYNQATVICEGLTDILQIPILRDVVIRSEHTDSQTNKGRIERWKNMEGKFVLTDPAAIAGRRVMLVDDVITTGATLEACGIELLKADGVRLSVGALCFANS